jgi:hypothetical protein
MTIDEFISQVRKKITLYEASIDIMESIRDYATEEDILDAVMNGSVREMAINSLKSRESNKKKKDENSRNSDTKAPGQNVRPNK